MERCPSLVGTGCFLNYHIIDLVVGKHIIGHAHIARLSTGDCLLGNFSGRGGAYSWNIDNFGFGLFCHHLVSDLSIKRGQSCLLVSSVIEVEAGFRFHICCKVEYFGRCLTGSLIYCGSSFIFGHFGGKQLFLKFVNFFLHILDLVGTLLDFFLDRNVLG